MNLILTCYALLLVAILLIIKDAWEEAKPLAIVGLVTVFLIAGLMIAGAFVGRI